MYESISRFMSTKEFEPHLDEMFGCEDWRDALPLSGLAKREFVRDLYLRQLSSCGMRYVRTFEMRDSGNRTEYFLFFGTHHIEGLKAMKDAMWNVDSSGGFLFSDATAGRLTLFETVPDYAQLKSEIVARFSKRTEVRIEEIEEFVVCETAFRETHFKGPILRPMAKSGEIKVQRPEGRNAAYWNTGTYVTFLV